LIKNVLDAESIAQHKKAADTLWEEVANRDAACKKAIEMLRAWKR